MTAPVVNPRWRVLSVEVYRNGAPPAHAPRYVFLTGADVEGPSTVADVDPDERLLVLDRRVGLMRRPQAPCLYDATADKNGIYAFGGTFAYCCDSRFSVLNDGYPIPIHDYAMHLERR